MEENTVIAEVTKLEGEYKTDSKCTVYAANVGLDEEVGIADGHLVIVNSETGEAISPITDSGESVVLTDLVLSATQASSKSKTVRKINQRLAREGYDWRIDSTDVYVLPDKHVH